MTIDKPTPEEAPEDSKRVKKKARRAVKQTVGLCRRTFKKKDGTLYEGDIWYMRYSVQDPNKPGKMKKVFKSTGTDNKTKAEELLTRRKAAVAENRHPELKRDNEISFKDFVEKHYLIDCKDQAGIVGKTNVCKHLIEKFGRYNLTEITAKLVAEYRKGKEKTCEVATVNRHLATIKHIYTTANLPEYNYVSGEKLLDIRSVKNKKEAEGRINYLSKAEVKTLLDKSKDTYLNQIIRWGINTGIRRGRIFKLTWSMIDVPNRFVHIPKDKHGERYDSYLNDESMKVLAEREKEKQDGVPYVFYNPETKDRWYDVKKIWATITEKAGLKDFHFHDMRHTFISWLVMSGVDIKTVQELAGHRTLAMTLKYAHLSPEHRMRAVVKLNYNEEPETPIEAPEEQPEETPEKQS